MAKLVFTILSIFIISSYQSSTSISMAQSSTTTPAASSTQATSTPPQKLKLTVYHESLCPDSKRFFLDQLVPTYRKIGDYIDLVSIPFGHARTIKPDRMVCQHEARECQRNRLMACVQTKGSMNMSEIVDSLGCLFQNEESPKSCLSKHMPTVDYDNTILTCQKSQESFQLMEEYEKLTGRIGYVPKITLNDKYSEDIQENCEHHLLEYLCKNLYETSKQQPEACKGQEQQETAKPSNSFQENSEAD